jgi:AcrR family transcriptional regulator
MRTKGSSGPKTEASILAAGLKLFHAHGYEGTSLRQIAAEVGIREGSLYNHIKSKQELLFRVVGNHMDHLLASLEAAIEDQWGAEARLKAFIAFHLTYHMERPAEVFVINSELRSLDREFRAAIVAKRDAYEKILIGILRQCAAEGFAVSDPVVAAKGFIAMLTGACTWFRPDGRLAIEELVKLYTEMISRSITR